MHGVCVIIRGVKQFLRVLFLFLAVCAVLPVGADALRVSDVRRMERAALDGSNPCTVTGLVTFVMSWLPGSVIVADPDNPDGPGVYVTDRYYGPMLARGFDRLRAGDILEMTANPVAMQLEPGFYVSEQRVIAHEDLPLPALVSVSSIMAGSRNNRRVRVRAVLISARVEGEGPNALTLLSLSTADGRITARVRGSHPEIGSLRDAEIEVEGIAMPVFNPRAEFRYAEIETLDGVQSILLVKAPPRDAFDVPERTQVGVLSWNPRGVDLHAVKVFGEVTYVNPDEGYFIVQHGKSAIMVFAEGRDLPSIGLALEVAGFPVMRQDTGVLMNAIYRVWDSDREPIVPYPFGLDEHSLLEVGGDVNDNDFAYRLVEVRGRVLQVNSLPGAPLQLVLEVDGQHVTVSVPFALDAGLIRRLADLPQVRVRGVLDTRLVRNLVYARYFVFGQFTVLPRSAADFEIVPDLAWWTRRAVRYGRNALLLLLLPLFATLAVVLIRRHRDRDRQRIVAADRKRIAGELHDTISQHISGAKLWVFAAKTAAGDRLPGPANDALNMAANVLEATRLEIRNAILDLQSDEFLSDSPTAMLQRFARASDVPGKVRVRTALRGLPSEMAVGHKRDLLALVQEAFSNAVRHGAAKNVIVVCEGDGAAFRLQVLNDGAPFDAASAPGPEAGHFGLSNMRERATRAQLMLTFGEHRGYRAVTLERKRA